MYLLAPDSYSKLQLSNLAKEHLTSDYFRVDDFGFMVLTSAEQYAEHAYPTPADLSPAGWFSLTVWPVAFADINGDSLDDLIVRPMMFPHVVPRQTEIQPLLLPQDAGGFRLDAVEIVDASGFPDKYFLSQIGVGDFDGDGYDDMAFGSEGQRFVQEDTTIYDTPLVVFGGDKTALFWSDSVGDVSASDYGASHNLTVGDFNGDGIDDWVSSYYAFYSKADRTFTAHRLEGIGNNATTAADFNHDGYDDLVFSNMPNHQDASQNGGDLRLMFGSAAGLVDGTNTKDIYRARFTSDNVGTSSIAHADFNGDGFDDLVLAEHGWISNNGDSSKYYSEGFFRLFDGNGRGDFVERTTAISDPHAMNRRGGANLFARDVNGDGWIDLVINGGEIGGSTWENSDLRDATSIFLNHKGQLTLVDPSDMAFVQPYQFSGYESFEQWQQTGVPRSYPVDIGNDGLMDFVGFVETPLTSLPQTEARYTYAYISRATRPLGRDTPNESLEATLGSDRVFGFDGNDTIAGLAGDDTIDGGDGVDIAVIASAVGDVSSMGFSADGLGLVIRSADGADTLKNIETIAFTDQSFAPYELRSVLEPSLTFAAVIDDKTVSLAPTFFTGQQDLGLHYQLIDTTPDAIVVGSINNDFIALQGGGVKAVDGGQGNDVIDGGTGSTFVTGGGGSNTIFLDGRADGTSWSTITDFQLGQDKVTVWGWREGISRVEAIEPDGGDEKYSGVTFHFENLLPDDASDSMSNPSLNSVTFTGLALEQFGVSSVDELNEQILAQTNDYFAVGQTFDQFGTHGYLHIE